MTALDLIRDLARLVPDRRTADRVLAHDETVQIALVVQRWTRHGRPGVPVPDGRWLCQCEAGEELCLVALPVCEICGSRRPGEIREDEWAAETAAVRRAVL